MLFWTYSLSANLNCMDETRKIFSYLAEEGRGTERPWSSSMASRTCRSTPGSSSTSSVTVGRPGAPLLGLGRSPAPNFVLQEYFTLCAQRQCRTADSLGSKTTGRSHSEKLCWPMGEGGTRRQPAESDPDLKENSLNIWHSSWIVKDEKLWFEWLHK
jgi:hypothetical protein